MKRSIKTPVYMVQAPTGLFDKNGIEFVVVVGVKLTRAAAEELADKNPGCEVVKTFADK